MLSLIILIYIIINSYSKQITLLKIIYLDNINYIPIRIKKFYQRVE